MSPTTSADAAAGGSDVRGDELSILVGGARWTGWQELQVVRSIDSAVGSFRVTIPPTLGSTWPLRPGDDVEVGLGSDTPLLVGRVDAVTAEFDKSARSVVVKGRDRAADLVDSTVSLGAFEWRGVTLRQVIEDVIAPFAVELGEFEPALSVRFDVFSSSSTEKAWAVIDRACRQKGYLAWSGADGRLVVSRPRGVASEVDLIEGVNVISARFRWDYANRFTTYRIEGQAGGSDTGWGDTIISLEGEAFDLEIPGFRPLTLRGEQGMTAEECLIRAQWEATFRRARSTALEVEVSGWRQAVNLEAPFSPWAVDMAPFVSLPSLGIEGTFLVSRVKFFRELKGGARTKLELVPPDSFTPKPVLDMPDSLNGFLISEEGAE